MAGIWERLKQGATDRVSAHVLDAAFVFLHAGTFTQQQVVNALNAQLASPLAGSELTDLSNISAQLAATSGTANKLVYLEKIKAATICAEAGVINEAAFRSALGIS